MAGLDLFPLIDLGDDSSSSERPADYLMTRSDVATLTASLGEALRGGSQLPRELIELAVLVVAVRRRSQLGVMVHLRLATAAGIDPTVTSALIAGSMPEGMDTRQELTVRVVDALISHGRIAKALYNDARALLGDCALAELVALVGYHTMMAMTTSAYRY